MSLQNTFEDDLLKLIFQAVPIANLADNAASSPLTNLYISLHTADPGEAGTQSSSETTYTSYARVAVVRSASGWDVASGVATPAANVDFPIGTGGSGTITHVGIGTASSGAGKLLMSGAVTPNLTVGNGIIPRLTTSSTITFD